MFGRVSIFGDEKVVELVKSKFVPVAVAIGTHGNALDHEGDLYRKIVAERSTESFQGFYVFDTQCHVLAHEGGSRHDAQEVRKLLERTSQDFRPAGPPEIRPAKLDARFFHQPPAGGLIVEVTSKLLDGFPGAPKKTTDAGIDSLGKGNFKLAVFDQSLGRDRLWIRKDEVAALAAGEFPDSLKIRIARFHLVDNTRCFPLFWQPEDLREVRITLKGGVLEGHVHLETEAGDRGYVAEMYGRVNSDGERVTRFDLVTKGKFWGGKVKGGHRPPEGKFPFAIAFRQSVKRNPYDTVPPAGTKDNDYLRRD